MTGLDQDMMQRIFRAETSGGAEKNMYCYGFSFVPLTFVPLSGHSAHYSCRQRWHCFADGKRWYSSDVCYAGLSGRRVLVLFTIGIIAAAFSNSDSALTAMTTSFCVDILRTGKTPKRLLCEKEQSACFVFCLAGAVYLLFPCGQWKQCDWYDLRNCFYTYGPLLGMFAFGLFTKRNTKDKYVP